MTEKLTDEEKDYYSLTRKAWAILAPFYDPIIAPHSSVRNTVVNFTNAKKKF